MSKKTAIILATIILASALLGSSLLTRGHWWGDDFAAYIMQAKSILTGNMESFVKANAFTVTQSSHQIGPAAYPWGFPLILTPVYALFGLSPLALKLPGLLSYLAFLATFFYLTKRRFTFIESLLAVSLFAVNPELLHYNDYINSDIPFLFLSTLSILLADIYAHYEHTKQRQKLVALTGVAIFAAFFVRTQGLILLGSILLFQGIRFLKQPEQRRQVVTDSLITLIAFGIPWGISSLIFPDGQTSYLALYSGFSTAMLKSNLIGYSKLFGDFFLSLPGQTIIFSAFAIFCFIGLVIRFKSDLLFVLYAALYLIVLWTWPEWQGYRFIFPMLPFFIYFSFQGIEFILEHMPEKSVFHVRMLVYIILITISGAFLINTSRDAYLNLQNNRKVNGPFDPFSMETYDFIKNETPPDAVIVFFKPRAMHLMTDRNTLALTECDRLTEGDYLALSKKVGENLQISPERISECNLPLEDVFENRRFVIYQVLK